MRLPQLVVEAFHVLILQGVPAVEQAFKGLLGWAAGAVLAICDGLVWAELGAAMPRAGGSYRYLEEIYGPRKLGRLLPTKRQPDQAAAVFKTCSKKST